MKSEAYITGMLQQAESCLEDTYWFEFRKRSKIKGIIWSCRTILGWGNA